MLIAALNKEQDLLYELEKVHVFLVWENMSYYIYYWKETDQEVVTIVNELQIIICEEFQTCSMNQSWMRSETEVSGSSFEVQQTLLFCSR